MKLTASAEFLVVLVSSVILSGGAFSVVSLWQFGNVNAQENEAAITLIPASTLDPNLSPFVQINKPKYYRPILLSIPAIGLADVNVGEISLTDQNRLGVPDDFEKIGWFKDGSKPGESGNAIFDGHYDKKDGSPAVFYNLGKLVKGDIISVSDEHGKQMDFELYDLGYVNVSDPVSASVAYDDTDSPIITLITCGGVWNPKEHNYNKRLLVKAKLI